MSDSVLQNPLGVNTVSGLLQNSGLNKKTALDLIILSRTASLLTLKITILQKP